MIITNFNISSTTLFMITFPIALVTLIPYIVNSDHLLEISIPSIDDYQKGLDRTNIENTGIAEGRYFLVDRNTFLTKTSFSLEDDGYDHFNGGYTKIINTIKYNKFNADSLKEALSKSKITGRDAQGLTQVRYNTSWYENSRGIITQVEIRLIIQIQLPLWMNLEEQCSNVREEWNDFIDKLQEHEEKHREIFENYYKDIHKRVIGKTAVEVNDSILPRWNKTSLLNEPAIVINQMQENYHQELEEKGLHPIPVDTFIKCNNS